MKRSIITLVLLVALFANVAMAEPFSDVPFSHWAYDAISKLASKGIVTGFPDGTFRGKGKMTRYEIALILARLLDEVQKGSVVVTKSTPVSTPSTGKTVDIDIIQKLTIEFADELALLGVKVHAIEDELTDIKEKVDAVKAEVEEVKALAAKKEEGNIQVSGKATQDNHIAAAGDTKLHAMQSKVRFYTNIAITKGISAYFRNDIKASVGTAAPLFANREGFIKINDLKGYGSLRIGRFLYKHNHDRGLALTNYINGVQYKISAKETNLAFTKFDLGWDVEILLAKTDANTPVVYLADTNNDGKIDATDAATNVSGDSRNFFETKMFRFRPHTNWSLADFSFFFAMKDNDVAKGLEGANYKSVDGSTWIGLATDFRFAKGEGSDRMKYHLELINSSNTNAAADAGGMAILFDWSMDLGEKRDRNVAFTFANFGEDYAGISQYSAQNSPFDSVSYGTTGRYMMVADNSAEANSLIALKYTQKWGKEKDHMLRFALNMETAGDKRRVIEIADTWNFAKATKISYGLYNYGADNAATVPWLNGGKSESETMIATQVSVGF